MTTPATPVAAKGAETTPETPVQGRESAREAAELVVDSLPFKLYPSNRRVSAVAAIGSAIEVDRHARDAAAEARERVYREALERIKVGDYTVIMEWSAEQAQREIATIKAIAARALAAGEALKQGGL